MPIDESRTEFTVVLIPADINDEVKEVVVPIPPGMVIESMINYVRSHINELEVKRKSSMSQEKLKKDRAAIGQALANQIKNNPQFAGLTLTDEMIDTIYMNNSVDQVVLQRPTKDNNYVGVYMYVDDQGVAKQLERNVRATGVCFAVGNRVEVLGDAFIARIRDNDDDFERIDFTLKDFSGDWITEAKRVNTATAGGSSSTTPSPSPSSSSTTTTTTETTDDGNLTETDKAYQLGNVNIADKNKICARGALKCLKVASLRCSRCKSIYYCSAEHQRAHWKYHKPSCKPQ